MDSGAAIEVENGVSGDWSEQCWCRLVSMAPAMDDTRQVESS